jgi:hypothetical protein
VTAWRGERWPRCLECEAGVKRDATIALVEDVDGGCSGERLLRRAGAAR